MSTTATSENTSLVREVQALMVLFSAALPDGKLSEAMKLALSTSTQKYGAKIAPVNSEGIHSFLESHWNSHSDSDRQRLLDWQKSGENMEGAVDELAAARKQLGLGEGV